MIELRLEARNFLSAASFLTVLPLPDPGWEEARLGRASAWFPVVGLLLGLVLGGVFLLLAPILPLAAPGIVLAAVAVLTGGLHEDGLADTGDALGARAGRARRLEIMKDSRIGAHGALALLFAVGLRWTALAALAPAEGALALVVALTAGRALMVPVPWLLPYARPEGTGALTARAGGRESAIALATALVVALAAGGAGLLALGLAALAAAGLAFVLRRAVGGYTGDGLGAICLVGETMVLVVLAAAWGPA